MVLSSLFSTDDTLDRNGEPGNVADGLFAIARAIDRLTEAAVLHVRVELGPPGAPAGQGAMSEDEPRDGHEDQLRRD